MNEETIIRDYYGRIIGYVETEPNGDKIFRDFYRRILGKYNKALNVTRDFYGRIVARGDAGTGLIYAEEEKRKNKQNKK